jgi:enamine deaminase RidA (YjgF/YER057c/UK114 family)
MRVQRVFSGAPWEERVGYCRALRHGKLVFVTGTAPLSDDGTVFAPGDGYRQAKRCFEIITRAMRQLGAVPADVVRTRLLVTDIRRWEEFGRAHKEFVGENRPCTTMVEVRALIDQEMLIEIEVDAICED